MTNQAVSLSITPFLRLLRLSCFHRGLSLALLVLAFLVLSVELFRQRGLVEQIAIGILALLIGARGVHSLAGLRAATRK